MKRFLILFSLVFIGLSCTDKPDTTVDNPIEEDPEFSLKLNGKEWIPSQYYFKNNQDGTSTLYATDKVYTFSWLFDSEIKEKEYVLGINENQLITSMYKGVGGDFKAYDILDGKLKIIKYSKEKQIFKAAFSFVAEYNSESVKIEDGKVYINKLK